VTKRILRFLGLAFVLLFSSPAPVSAESSKEGQFDTKKIEQLTGNKGNLDKSGKVFKVSAPRKDLAVTIKGIKLPTAMGLTSWAAFEPVGSDLMVMGDMVLTEDQVNPIMDIALANGLNITALHNHFFWETPKIMFMHIDGMGNEEMLASAVGKLFSKIKEPSDTKKRKSFDNINSVKNELNTQAIDKILGVKGVLSDRVYKVVIDRTTKMHDSTVGDAMGVNTWAAFYGSNENAIFVGDIAMHESELQTVLKALRKFDIDIVAIHQHMIGENPRIIFLHYFGSGTAETLAKGLRTALDATSGK